MSWALYKSLVPYHVSARELIPHGSPSGPHRFRLMGFMLAQGVVGGAVTIKDNTGGATILIIPQNTAGVSVPSPPMGNGILSAAANNVLTATGSATETITGFFFGTEE